MRGTEGGRPVAWRTKGARPKISGVRSNHLGGMAWRATPRRIMAIMGRVMLATEKVAEEKDKEPRRPRMAMAVATSGARKKIQVRQTKWKVTKMLRYRPHRVTGRLPCIFLRTVWEVRRVVRPTPWRSPQRTKGQPMPCQRPPSNMTMMG